MEGWGGWERRCNGRMEEGSVQVFKAVHDHILIIHEQFCISLIFFFFISPAQVT